VLLFPRNPEGDCVLRSLAICHAMWREGWPAHFVSGVRREGGELKGHAWVELDGRVIAALCEATNRDRYAVLLEYPRPTEPAAGGTAAA
ncbi:MAG TPA: lasso peptide biosynthesis B2 protein, partial [Gemmatimonadaceae bacterium]